MAMIIQITTNINIILGTSTFSISRTISIIGTILLTMSNNSTITLTNSTTSTIILIIHATKTKKLFPTKY